jgi:hypothetical protein
VPNDPALPFVGWRDVTSDYGPLFTLGSYPAGLVGVLAALWMFKILAADSVLASPHSLLESRPGKARTRLGRPHSSASTRSCSCTSSRARTTTARCSLALGVFGVSSLESLRLVEQDQAATSKYSVPATAARLLNVGVDPVRYTAPALYVVVLLLLVVWTLRGGDWIQAAGWAALGLLLATDWLMPWYVIWVLPFAAIVKDSSLSAATLALCAFQLINRIPL